jgi:hypothetical protein
VQKQKLEQCAPILMLLIALIAVACQFGAGCGAVIRQNGAAGKKKEKPGQDQDGQIGWQKQPGDIRPNLDSTSSLVLPGKKIRTYFVEDGFVSFIESEDGVTFRQTARTNIGPVEQEGNAGIPADPVVLLLRSGRFMMLFNTGQSKTQLLNNPRYTKLHLAYSDDGINFDYQGVVNDLDKDPYAIVNQVDALALGEGSIRIYGADNGISTAVSKDGGRTWITDGLRLIGQEASEPDVHLDQNGDYVMYYVSKERRSGYQGRHIRMAESGDGLEWKLLKTDQILPEKDGTEILNPDHVVLDDSKEIMFFSDLRIKKGQSIEVVWRTATKNN